MTETTTTKSSKSLNAVILGGDESIALRLGKRLTGAGHSVTSVIRDEKHASDIEALKATPKVLSLEDAPMSDFSSLFENRDLVYFTAGAEGKDGVERTRQFWDFPSRRFGKRPLATQHTGKVDYECALKIFDAIDGVRGHKPELVMLSAIDARGLDKTPAHYNDEDKATSQRIHSAVRDYMQAKYDAEKNLVQRDFDWFILRPSALTDEEGTGKVNVGSRIRITPKISRDDVAHLLFLLATRPHAARMALDAAGGDNSLKSVLDEAIEKGESAFLD